MFNHKPIPNKTGKLMAGVLATGLLVSPAWAQTSAPAPKPAAVDTSAVQPPVAPDAPAGQAPVDTQPASLRYRRLRHIPAAKPGVATDAPAPKAAAVARPKAANFAAVSEPRAAIPATAAKAPAARLPATTAHSRYRPERFARRATLYYDLIWGVDALSVKWTESGEVIRFSYRILDAEKAKPLNDKRAEPALIDPRAGVKLVVPSLEKVGQLRQSSTPVAGKVYWMAFSNKGRPVKRGDHVNLVIGKFHAEGLVVD